MEPPDLYLISKIYSLYLGRTAHFSPSKKYLVAPVISNYAGAML
jgi:hypothetical protein